MNLKIKVLLLFLLLAMTVKAQQQQQQTVKVMKGKTSSLNQVQNLKIGNNMPDVLIPKVINDEYSSIRSTAFKNQLLIVDFWFTNCASCVAGLPKMMSLQQEFGNRIKILPVTFEKEKLVSEFLKNNRLTKDVIIPSVVEDKILSKLFKHAAAPHEVWVYNGKVIAITEQDYVNSENIAFILNGGKNDWPVKNDYLPAVDIKTPLIRQDLGRFTGINPFKRYAAILGCYQDGVITKIGTEVDSVKNTRRNYIVNLPILNIYLSRWHMATGLERWPQPSSILLEVKDMTRFVSLEDSPETNFIKRQKTFVCYESIGPNILQSPQEIAKETISDLDHLLNLNGRYEKRKIKCLILVQNGSIDAIKSKSENSDGEEFLVAPKIKIMNKTLDNLVWKLNQFYGNPPVFNETNYNGNVNLEFSLTSWQNIPELRERLKVFGLNLKEEEREMEVFVLTEEPSKQ